jgi:hypothetical protein
MITDPDIPEQNPFAPPTGQPKEEKQIIIIQQVVQPKPVQEEMTFADVLCCCGILTCLLKFVCPCRSSLTFHL